ncbi:unnamed protein product [Caenorhabditis angaria]|uniref:C2H2-type domain-containing protein n=1 Tax=Caenorhabditis angaria TaxID=860376 RepID=A0A9P1IHX9_9PELO|nr:unnamed protein product [Caenorhabditis angaria]
MYVVISMEPGATLNQLMVFMTQKAITFSVTDRINKLCDKNVNPEKCEISTQTEEQTQTPSISGPPAKKSRPEECDSPCSSATPSEPTIDKNGWDSETALLKNLIDGNDNDKETDEIQAQIYAALFAKIQPENMDEESESSNPTPSLDLNIFNNSDTSGSNYRYKAQYASTKRGVCQVCNREVSLITTHRKRHANTHLGFKSLKCTVCHKYFARQDLGTGHFKKEHPDMEFIPFVDTMSADDEQQLALMMNLCFPEEMSKKNKSKAETEASTSPSPSKTIKDTSATGKNRFPAFIFK